jgi:DNA replication protein DnaC
MPCSRRSRRCVVRSRETCPPAVGAQRGDYGGWLEQAQARAAAREAELAERRVKQAAFIATINACPGEPLPCRLDATGLTLNLDHPDVVDAIPCPVAERERCARFVKLGALRAADRAEQHRQRGRRMGVPARFLDVGLGADQDTAAIRRVGQYLTGGEYAAGRCLVLGGPPGTGKTTGGVRGAYEAPPRARGENGEPLEPRFVFFGKLIARLLDPQRRAEALALAEREALVVLDDVGSAYVKADSFGEALVEEWLVTREAAVLPLVMTTNLAPAALTAALGDRLADRLRAHWATFFAVTGPSHRGGEGRA